MRLEIKELYNLQEEDYTVLFDMYTEAFRDYPKLQGAFPDWSDRQTAIEMVLRYYMAYDLKYGIALSLDKNINEAAVIVHSDYMDYSDERIENAVCESEAFLEAESRLNERERKLWWEFFDELDLQEKKIDIPRPHIYVDFVAARKNLQGEGRGSRLVRAICRYADNIKLPVMLFTNGEKDVRFYEKNGFVRIGIAESDKYKMQNVYMLYIPDTWKQIK